MVFPSRGRWQADRKTHLGRIGGPRRIPGTDGWRIRYRAEFGRLESEWRVGSGKSRNHAGYRSGYGSGARPGRSRFSVGESSLSGDGGIGRASGAEAEAASVSELSQERNVDEVISLRNRDRKGALP